MLPILKGLQKMAFQTAPACSVNAADESVTARFRRRRALNWVVLGVTYSALYMGRYNLALVNPLLSKAYGWDKTQIGGILSPALAAYGIFAMVNGSLTDRIGGRAAMLLATAGSMTFNLLFGLGAFFSGAATGGTGWLLTYFTVVWMMNAYFQSFGAVSLIKINAAWFQPHERGVFSAIFGSMIQLGRALVFVVGPWLMLFCSWPWMFFLPAAIIALMGGLTFLWVRNEPPQADVRPDSRQLPVSAPQAAAAKTAAIVGLVSRRRVIHSILTQPLTLAIAVAEFCTGFVRHGFEQWFPRYLVEVQHLELTSSLFQKNAVAVVLAGIVGAVFAGTLSDWVFQGRRTPVAALGYSLQIVALLLITAAPAPIWVSVAFVLHSTAISMVQCILSGTASMDCGGKQAAGTVAGFFDGMQYLGGSIAGLGLGWILEHQGWGFWGPTQVCFATVGLLLMLCFSRKSQERSVA